MNPIEWKNPFSNSGNTGIVPDFPFPDSQTNLTSNQSSGNVNVNTANNFMMDNDIGRVYQTSSFNNLSKEELIDVYNTTKSQTQPPYNQPSENANVNTQEGVAGTKTLVGIGPDGIGTESQSSETSINTYTIQKGDTLSGIAHANNQKGAAFMSVEALAILNGIDNPNNIYTGEELVLTADKTVVDGCITKLGSFISLLENVNDATQKIPFTEAYTDNGGDYDTEISTLKANFLNNTQVIINDANAYKSWLSELSKALEDQELYATNVIDAETMFSGPTGF